MKKIVLILTCSSVLLSGCARQPVEKFTGNAMGTYAEITISSSDIKTLHADSALSSAFEAIKDVENVMSSFKPETPVSRINVLLQQGQLNDFKLDDKTFLVFKEAVQLSKITEGAFDVTAGPLVSLWGFYSNNLLQNIPSQKDIDSALEKAGFRNISLNSCEKSVSIMQRGARIDLAGIAKGYGVDEAVRILKAKGVNNAIVNVGGEIYCLGEKARGEAWKVGVQHPRDSARIAGFLKISDCAVATSGDYENFITLGGKRYSHIIDPRTGYPADTGVVGATIVAEKCMVADGIATAVVVLGLEDAIRFLSNEPSLSAIIAYEVEGEDGLRLAVSLSLKDKLVIEDSKLKIDRYF